MIEERENDYVACVEKLEKEIGMGPWMAPWGTPVFKGWNEEFSVTMSNARR